MIVLLLFVGSVVGGAIAGGEGVTLGAALGALAGMLLGQQKKVDELARSARLLQQDVEQARMELVRVREHQRLAAERMASMEQQVQAQRAAATPKPEPEPEPAPVLVQPEPERVPEHVPERVPESWTVAASTSTPTPEVRPAPARLDETERTLLADPLGDALGWLRELLFGGNTVVRVGILVLLVGITLLLKYAAEHSMFPVELRMASAGLLGMGLVGLGLRLRERKPGFARTLQGGGVAAMYLVVFFSYRTYALVPSGLAFSLLAVIAAASAALAVAQSSMALVLIGQAGGFLAPILASSGSGNHVALFSYYLILNLGIFAVAFFRAFRPLNLLGFLFTFGIGASWGVLSYRPQHFATTEPFLIAFFLMYVAIPVLYALRHGTRGILDGSLVFGAPLAFLVLQRLLVDERPFAMAWTTLGMAALYLALTRFLKARAPQELRAMMEAFLALGVGFATLAVPYGLDNAGLSGATWAVEGAGLYWIGVRQERRRSRLVGVLLQGMAGIALVVYFQGASATDALPVLNTRMLGATLLALSGLFVAHHAYLHRSRLHELEWRWLQALVGWALLFFVPIALDQIDDHVAQQLVPGASIALVAAVAIALELVGGKLAWAPARYPAAALVVLLYPIAQAWDADLGAPIFERGGLLGWPLYAASVLLTLRRFVPEAPAALRYLHLLALWGALLTTGLELHRITHAIGELGDGWRMAAWALPAVAALSLSWRQGVLRLWPFSAEPDLYRGTGALGLALGLLLWSLAASVGAPGASAPLPYLPLLNPLDLVQLLALAAVLAFHRTDGRREPPLVDPDLRAATPAVLAGFAFLAWNALLARAVHQLADVSFAARPLWRAMPLQVALSISWSVIGLGVTALASRRGMRTTWMAGTTLLGVVVLKLFVVDLERLGTVPKIATFLIVGLLLLVVGYLAPVPPSRAAATEPEVTR